MAISNRDFYSQIVNNIKALNIDDFIAPKFVLTMATNIAADFIKKDNDNRRLWKMSEGWKEAECLPLIEVPITSCPDLDTFVCKRLMRTKDKLPDTYSTRYGNLIKHVASINFGQFYDPVSPRQYKAIMNRQFVDYKKKYYFFIGGYIYIPDSQVESIRIEAFFKKPWEVDVLNAQNEDCSTCNKNICVKPLDYEFVAPEYLFNNIKEEVLKQLRGVYLQVKTDEYPNLDSNQKDPK